MILEVYEYQKNITPISVFSSIREKFGAPIALLESALTDESNPFSIVAFLPVQEIVSHENTFEKLKKTLARTKKFPQNFHFAGGLIGYFNWEVFHEIEKNRSATTLPAGKPIDHQQAILPHAIFYEFSRFFIFDHSQQKIFAIQTHFKNSETFHAENLEILSIGNKKICSLHNVQEIQHEKNADFRIFTSEQTKDEFTEKITWAKEKILDGEVFQIIVSNGFECNVGELSPRPVDGLDFYEALREIEPTTHLFFLDFGEHGQIAGASPEVLGSKRGNTVLYSPIAGTRYRGKNEKTDLAIQKEMMDDPKENAEHDMLVDLGRNDLGRVCEPGSIKIMREKYTKKFANLMHLVTDLTGKIRPEFDAIDYFKAIFPAGTLSGAPKIRSIALIEHLEPNRRNLYGGAMGYFSADGDMEFCITIRSFYQKDGILSFRTGAGIVKDSLPEKEWLEVHNKAKSLCKIINYVLKGGQK